MARPCSLAVALLLLAHVSSLGEGASNPGVVARITRKGLEYARQYGMAFLKKELPTINISDFSGSYSAGLMGKVSYEFTRLRIHRFELRNSDLSLHGEHDVRASLSNNYVSLSGQWKARKAFITLEGSFDLSVDGISISISLNLGKDQSGRPTASVTQCSNSVGHISVDISGQQSWILKFLRGKIENNFKSILTERLCEMARTTATSYLEPYLRTLPVTSKIDQVAGIDYSLVGAPQVISQGLDMPFKGEFFSLSQRSPVPFDAPPISMPQGHDHMIYFAASPYVLNTASRVYHQAGRMNFTLQTGQIPLDFPVKLNTNSIGQLIPELAKLYPNMEMELEMSPESAPFLMFTPGNVTCRPVMNIQAFALLPNSSDREPLFLLRVKTDISVTINVSSGKIFGSLTPRSMLKLELKHSNIDSFNVALLESTSNYLATHFIYPSLNAKLEEGFPLPLPRDTRLNSLELQIHENFLLIGANIYWDEG